MFPFSLLLIETAVDTGAALLRAVRRWRRLPVALVFSAFAVGLSPAFTAAQEAGKPDDIVRWSVEHVTTSGSVIRGEGLRDNKRERLTLTLPPGTGPYFKGNEQIRQEMEGFVYVFETPIDFRNNTKVSFSIARKGTKTPILPAQRPFVLKNTFNSFAYVHRPRIPAILRFEKGFFLRLPEDKSGTNINENTALKALRRIDSTGFRAGTSADTTFPDALIWGPGEAPVFRKDASLDKLPSPLVFCPESEISGGCRGFLREWPEARALQACYNARGKPKTRSEEKRCSRIWARWQRPKFAWIVEYYAISRYWEQTEFTFRLDLARDKDNPSLWKGTWAFAAKGPDGRIWLKKEGRQTWRRKVKQYRIGALRFNLMPLRMTAGDLDARIENVRQDIAAAERAIQQYEKRQEEARRRLSAITRKQKAARAAVAAVREAIVRLRSPPEMTALDKTALAQIRKRISETELKRDAGLLTGSQAAALLRRDRQLLADLERRLNRLRPAQYRDRVARERKIGELREEIAKLESSLLKLRYDQRSRRFDRDYAARQHLRAKEEHKVLGQTLAHLERLRSGLKERLSSANAARVPIEGIVIRDEKGRTVYAAYPGKQPHDALLRAFERKIDDMRERLRQAQGLRRRALRAFVSESRKSISLGEELARTILQAARNKRNVAVAKIAAGVMKDFVKGGLVSAAGGAAYKLLVETPALNLAAGRSAFARKQVSSFDESLIRLQMSREFGKFLRAENSATGEFSETARGVLKRAGKAGLSTALKDRTKNVLLRNAFGRWAQSMAVKGRMEDLDSFLREGMPQAWLKRRMVQNRGRLLEKMIDDLAKLKKPNPVSGMRGQIGKFFDKGAMKRALREFDLKKAAREQLKKSPALVKKFGQSMAEGMVMDFAENSLKKYFESTEKRAWIAYLTQETTARSLFAGWKVADMHYWEISDMLQALIEARNRFLEETDQDSNFRVKKNEPFTSDAKLTIHLYTKGKVEPLVRLKPPHAAAVEVDGVQTRQERDSLGFLYKMDAATIDRPDGARLPLLVILH